MNVTWPGVSRISIGKVACIIAGIPSAMHAMPVDGGGSPFFVSSADRAWTVRHSSRCGCLSGGSGMAAGGATGVFAGMPDPNPSPRIGYASHEPLIPRTTAGACVKTDSQTNAVASRATSVSRNRMRPSLNGCAPGDGAVRELTPIGERDLLEQRAGLAAAKRRHDHRDTVARLDHVELPAGAIEDAGAGALDQPVLPSARLLVDRVHVDVDVRIDPLELGDDARELDLQRRLVRRERVMSDGR